MCFIAGLFTLAFVIELFSFDGASVTVLNFDILKDMLKKSDERMMCIEMP